MKKIGRMIGRFFRHIGLFFDKWLITPITKLILRIMGFFKGLIKSFDRISGRKSTLLVVSLLLAFGVFVVIDQESNVMIDQYAEILYKQKVTANYNEELYVVEGLPETVDVVTYGIPITFILSISLSTITVYDVISGSNTGLNV